MPTMRLVTLILALTVAFAFYACGRAKFKAATLSTGDTHPVAVPASFPTAPTKVDFTTQIRPILEARCQPCHFSGGKVYQKLPFDRPETIKTLGTKLFTRIKDEKEQALIREFLTQQ